MTDVTTTSSSALERAPRRSLPGVLLRLEGLAVFLGAIALYADGGWSWLAFAALLFAPDLSMIGYLRGPRTGAYTYDIVHCYALPLALGVVALLAASATGVQIALVWAAHIGMDRTIGYGLKYPTNFKDTHLQRL